MKNFVVGLLTNRFGIVLATLNVCYFVSDYFTNIFKTSNNFGKIIVVLNVPAIILTAIPLRIMDFLFSIPNLFSQRQLLSFIFLFFVTLQWLFIGWLAKTIALKIQAIKS